MDSRKRFFQVGFFLLLTLFFLSTSILSFGIPDQYTSPDERAVSVSIQSFARGEGFAVTSGVEEEPLVHPRSFVPVGGYLVPVGFPGLFLLFGFVASVISFSFVPYLTSILAIVAGLAWYQILKRFLSQRVAFIGAFLLFLLPSFWFYTARAFMPNVPFVTFLIFALFFLIVRPLKRPRVDVALAGIATGLALLFRTSEIFAVVLAVGAFLLFLRPSVSWRLVGVFILSAFLALLPLFFWNLIFFGDLLTIGYLYQPATTVLITEGGVTSAWWTSAMQLLFPFGVHPRLAWTHFSSYQLGLVWWMTGLSVMGLPMLVAPRPKEGKHARVGRALVFATFTSGLYLTLLYGSWKIVDNPDPSAITLANSYMRYWLPIFVAGTIPSALAVDWLVSRARTVFAQRIFLTTLLLIISTLSIRLVFFHPEDGLVATRAVLFEQAMIRDRVVAETETNAVIVVDRADKILFPARQVIVPLRADATYDVIPSLLETTPVYYYGITLPETDLTYLNEMILKPRGVYAKIIDTIGIESLYRFERL